MLKRCCRAFGSTLRSRLLLELSCAVFLMHGLAAQGEPAARVLVHRVLDNGDFSERYLGDDSVRSSLIPWWDSTLCEDPPAVAEVEGTHWLVLKDGQRVSQPVWAYGPGMEAFELSGRVRGSGALLVTDGSGQQARFEWQTGDQVEDFAIGCADLRAQLGANPVPRLELELLASADAKVCWTDLDARVVLPAVTTEELRQEIQVRLGEIFATWLEHGLDPESGFIVGHHDAITAERLAVLEGGIFPLWIAMFRAWSCGQGDAWTLPLEAFLEAYLERGFAPETHLPARWQLGAGPMLDRFFEVHLDLEFLLDIHERGPERFRERALELAQGMAATVLEHGVLPDGTIAASYRSRDAEVNLGTSYLRHLDVADHLTRLSALTGNKDCLAASELALATLEFTHDWPCTWDKIDPGFDDRFGRFGARVVSMAESFPDKPSFRYLLDSGYDYYAERWHDALRFGGTLAADQTRCWELLLRYAQLEPKAADRIQQLVPLGLRAHLKGQQYKNAAWGDVTIKNFRPKTGIQVGDLPGTPANLLEGIAFCYKPELFDQPHNDAATLRAIYAAVLRSTVKRYKRPNGYLMRERERTDSNPSGGGLRLLTGLAEMLERLEGE